MTDAYTQSTQRIAVEHTDCALVQDLLPLYLDNEVSPESHARIADHITQCERCASYLAGARSVRSQLLQGQQPAQASATAASYGPSAQQHMTKPFGHKLGRILLLTAGAIGLLILVPVLIPLAIVAAIPVGLYVLIRSIMNGWPNQHAGTPASGANKAFWTAVLSVLGAVLGVGLVIGGVAMISDGWYVQDRIIGILLALIGFGGLVRINQQRGWLPQYATPPVAQQLLHIAVISGAVLAGLFLVQSSLANMPPLLIVAGVAVLLWWWKKK